MTARRLGVGFIGSGFNARFHLHAFQAVRDADVRGVGLQTPRTSASRTAWKACRWNRALKPLPMNPTPSRRAVITSALPPSPAFSPSPASSPVAHPELRERL